MKRQAYNPYLPAWEYIPDGEPRVFGDRLYIFGSHDRFGAEGYCENDYVAWSAPVEDLSDWRYEGVIFRKDQTPWNTRNQVYYAPDCVQGPDGRYYLYYFVVNSSIISVAVCDKPAGKYEYLGDVACRTGMLTEPNLKNGLPLILQFWWMMTEEYGFIQVAASRRTDNTDMRLKAAS